MMTEREESTLPAPWAQIPNTVKIELHNDASAEQKKRFNADFVFHSVLRAVFKFSVEDLFSPLDFSRIGVVDITFFSLAKCKRIVADWKTTDARLRDLRLRPYAQEYYSVTVTMYNPYTSDKDVLAYLRRVCADVKGGTHLRHSLGEYRGRRRYAVHLRTDPRQPR